MALPVWFGHSSRYVTFCHSYSMVLKLKWMRSNRYAACTRYTSPINPPKSTVLSQTPAGRPACIGRHALIAIYNWSDHFLSACCAWAQIYVPSLYLLTCIWPVATLTEPSALKVVHVASLNVSSKYVGNVNHFLSTVALGCLWLAVIYWHLSTTDLLGQDDLDQVRSLCNHSQCTQHPVEQLPW